MRPTISLAAEPGPDLLAVRNVDLTLTYGFGSGALNNGNLVSQQIVSPAGTFTQNYEYDGLGRLLKFSEGSLLEENVYDRYGNRAVYSAAGQSGPALAAKVAARTVAVEAVYPGNNRATGSSPDDQDRCAGGGRLGDDAARRERPPRLLGDL